MLYVLFCFYVDIRVVSVHDVGDAGVVVGITVTVVVIVVVDVVASCVRRLLVCIVVLFLLLVGTVVICVVGWCGCLYYDWCGH